MRLSVLDQSIAVAGRPQDQSIRNTVALAKHCEALGYERFWVSEHHNHPTIVGTAPEIVIAAIAATTDRIRIGAPLVLCAVLGGSVTLLYGLALFIPVVEMLRTLAS